MKVFDRDRSKVKRNSFEEKQYEPQKIENRGWQSKKKGRRKETGFEGQSDERERQKERKGGCQGKWEQNNRQEAKKKKAGKKFFTQKNS